MYIKKLEIAGFKCFPQDTLMEVELQPGLNILVGENGSGKSAVIDSIRLALGEDEYGRTGINESSFYKPFVSEGPSISASSIEITCTFEAEADKE